MEVSHTRKEREQETKEGEKPNENEYAAAKLTNNRSPEPDNIITELFQI
jgi:hypothetical protein